MRVQSLFVYPVKSLAGIEVSELQFDDFGPAGDRRWMLVDDLGEFVTQRKLPVLANVIAAPNPDGGISVTIPGQRTFQLIPGEPRVVVNVWRDSVEAQVGPEAANLAISHYCGQSLRFVYMPDDSFRRIDPAWVSEHRRVGFSDGFPLLIANQSSLDELNSRLLRPVEMRRFRPNIVISGSKAWSEDHWKHLTVGNVGLEIVKPCSRCVMTTIDPGTGTKDPEAEPLRTLSGFRKTEGGVIFGQNAVHQSLGRIAVGDLVTISKQEL